MGKGKSSPILWGSLGVLASLVAGAFGVAWWNETMGLRAQGVEGARTQNGLRLIARHREIVATGTAPHPMFRFLYELFRIPTHVGGMPHTLEVDLPTPIPLPQFSQALPKNCSAVAVTPSGSRFALSIKAAPQTGRAPYGNAGGAATPPTRSIVVSVPRALPVGMSHLDVTLTAPGGRASWRLTGFGALPAQIQPPVPTQDTRVEGDLTLRAVAWTFPEGIEEKVWVLPNGQKVMVYRSQGFGSTKQPPFPNATVETQRRDPDQIRVAVWSTWSRQLPTRQTFAPPPPGNDRGETPPASPYPEEKPRPVFDFARVTAQWDDGQSGLNMRGSAGFSNQTAKGRYEVVDGRITRSEVPAFGGEQKWVKAEGMLSDYKTVEQTLIIRDVAVKKSGNDLVLAPTPAQEKVKEGNLTVRLHAKTNQQSAAGVRSHFRIIGNRGVPTTSPSGAANGVAFDIEWFRKPTKRDRGNGGFVYGRDMEFFYRDDTGAWRRMDSVFMNMSTQNGRGQFFIPGPVGTKIRALAVRIRHDELERTRPISFVVPVHVGKPPEVPGQLLEM
jgi:hypothetical protein